MRREKRNLTIEKKIKLAQRYAGGEDVSALSNAYSVTGFRRAMAKVLLHLSGPRLAAHGMTSYRSDWFELHHADPVMIDGELVPRADDGKLQISLTEPLMFLR